MDEIKTRVSAAPVSFTLQAQLADPSDPVNDATKPYPPQRKVVELGKIVLSKAGPRPQGFRLSPDEPDGRDRAVGRPAHRRRTNSYAISFSRRAQ